MRHRKKYSRLGLTTNQRKALLKGLTISLLEHGAIVTTKARAKQLRAYAERIISKVKKEDESHARRLVFRKLQSKMAVKKLFDEYKEEFVNRPGGYTRIHLLGNRPGDAAEMARISLVLGTTTEEPVTTEEKKPKSPTKKSPEKADSAEKSAKGKDSEAKELKANPVKKDQPEAKKPKEKTVEKESKAE